MILKGHDAYCKVGESFQRLGRMLFESRWVISGDREVDCEVDWVIKVIVETVGHAGY